MQHGAYLELRSAGSENLRRPSHVPCAAFQKRLAPKVLVDILAVVQGQKLLCTGGLK